MKTIFFFARPADSIEFVKQVRKALDHSEFVYLNCTPHLSDWIRRTIPEPKHYYAGFMGSDGYHEIIANVAPPISRELKDSIRRAIDRWAQKDAPDQHLETLI